VPEGALRAEFLDRLAERATPPLDDSGRLPRSLYCHHLESAWRHPLMTYEFERQFHATRRLSLRLLHPFHDEDLSAFLNRVDPLLLVGGGAYKGLVRHLLEARLPGMGLKRQVKTSGDRDLARRELARSVKKHTGEWAVPTRLGSLGLVHVARFSDMLSAPDGLTLGAVARLFIATSAERWLAAHGS
jgi:hypothetical protein